MREKGNQTMAKVDFTRCLARSNKPKYIFKKNDSTRLALDHHLPISENAHKKEVSHPKS
jgi:hypothetical protein